MLYVCWVASRHFAIQLGQKRTHSPLYWWSPLLEVLIPIEWRTDRSRPLPVPVAKKDKLNMSLSPKAD
jgi:hypothetical protein